jgi:hypothetical protein
MLTQTIVCSFILQQYLFKREVVAQTEADAHGSEARDWDLHVAEFLSVDHVRGGKRSCFASGGNLKKGYWNGR